MKLLVLLSGGIDSPVAAWMMRRLGHEISFIHFHNYTPQQAAVRQKILDIVKILGGGKLFMVPFAAAQTEVIKHVPAKYRMIIYRRLMLRIAAAIAKKEKVAALVTGDNLAQVASQTLDNIYVIDRASPLPVLRPLLGAEKNETVNVAKQIGTYNLSILPYSDCCTYMVAEHPETRANLKLIEQMEATVELDKIIKDAVRKTEVLVERGKR